MEDYPEAANRWYYADDGGQPHQLCQSDLFSSEDNRADAGREKAVEIRSL
jgi:hypothetical protein